MKNVRDLVNLIVKGSVATKVTAGVVATTIVVGGSVGAYYGFKHLTSSKVTKQELIDNKQYVLDSIQGLEVNISKLPEEVEVDNLKKLVEELKSIDLDENLETALEKLELAFEEYDKVVKVFMVEIENLVKEVKSYDISKFSTEQIKEYNNKVHPFLEAASSQDFLTYKDKYNEVKKVYEKISASLNQEGSQEVPNNAENNPEQDWSTGEEFTSSSHITVDGSLGSTSNSSSSNGGSSNTTSSNVVSSNSSSNSSSSNSSSSNSGNLSASSGEVSNNTTVETPAVSGSTGNTDVVSPSAPSRSTGYQSDVESAIYSTCAVGTNVHGSEVMSTEHYNYLYSIAEQLTNGSIDVSTARNMMTAQSFDFMGFSQTACDISAMKFDIAGCDWEDIFNNGISPRLQSPARNFCYVKVYYNASTNTSTVTYIQCNVW